MVPFVLVVVLFAVASQVAGPLLQQLRGRSQWAEYIARVVDFAGIMSGNDGESSDAETASARPRADSAGSRSSARRPGRSDSAAVPSDIPLQPHALENLYNVGPDHILIYQRIAETRVAVIGRVRDGMRQQGWKLLSETPGDWSTMTRWSKGNRSCMVEIAGDSAATEIWIRSRQSPVDSRQSPVPRR